MAICPANCTDIELVDNPGAGLCEADPRRKRSLYKIGFYKCSTVLPSPLTCANLETLITSKALVFTSPLEGVAFAEPQIAERKLNDCDPTSQIVVGRELTFNDRYKVTIPAIPGDPGVKEDKYADLAFWKNKKDLSLQLRVVFLYCDGSIEIPKDDDGKPLSSTFLIYRDYERVTEGTDENIYEVKRGTIRFKGDPLSFNPPDLEIAGSECSDLAELLGISA